MDIYAVRQAIADAVDGLEIQNSELYVTATAYTPDAIVAPHFFIAEYEVDYNKSMGGLTLVTYTCRVLLAANDEQSSQRALDSLFNPSGDTSLKAAIEAERNTVTGGFGGIVQDFRVERMYGNRRYTHDAIDYVGGEITITVRG